MADTYDFWDCANVYCSGFGGVFHKILPHKNYLHLGTQRLYPVY